MNFHCSGPDHRLRLLGDPEHRLRRQPSRQCLVWQRRDHPVAGTLRGLWNDQANTLNVLSIGGEQPDDIGGDSTSASAGSSSRVRAWVRRSSVRHRDHATAGNLGVVVFNGGSGATFTLPRSSLALPGARPTSAAWFEVVNTTANNLTLATSSSHLFNRTAAKTSGTIGSASRVTACKDAAGTLFWYARAVTLP